MTRSLAVALNALGLYAIALVLAAAFAAQLLLGELPCPLCLLQRIQFALLAIGPILNVRFGPRPSHYAASLLVAAAGAAFAMRQILLHITPGIPAMAQRCSGITIHLGLHRIRRRHRRDRDHAAVRSPVRGRRRHAAGRGRRVCAYRGVAGDRTHCGECDFNLAECGLAACPADPVAYELLKGMR